MKKTKAQIAMSKLGAYGGKSTLKKYGKEYFQNLQKKSAVARRKKSAVDNLS